MNEYEYKEVCKRINEQIKPSDEFIERMKINIEQKLQRRQNKLKYNFTKVAASFITVTLLSTGAVAFADDIGNLFDKIFKNSDPSVKLAIENGYIQNVEMDYVEHDGIGIKVNSIIVDDNKLDIILDVNGGEFDDAYFEAIVVDKNDTLDISSQNDDNSNISFETKWKNIDKNNHMLIIKVSNIDENIIELEKLNLVLDTMCILKENNMSEIINEKWNFLINVDRNILVRKEDNTKYYVKNDEKLEYYNIEVYNTSMNVQLKLKNESLREAKLSRDGIIIKDENNKEYNCKEFSGINQNTKTIEMNIPLTVYNKIDKFKIFINLENQVIELDVEKQKD